MRTKLGVLWEQLGTSLWFVPAIMTLGALALAAATVALDSALQVSRGSDLYFAFGGGVSGARGILGAIVSTMITVTGVIFSITIVALQLASSQFTPRILRNFMADRISQVVLGLFIGTFTYALLVLRTVRSPVEDGAAFVPSFSVGVAMLLALTSIGSLIVYIHHSARSIQVPVILSRAVNETTGLIDRLFPEMVGEPSSPPRERPSGVGAVVTTSESGYLQAVDDDGIIALPSKRPLIIQMEPRVGEFVLPGAPLATVWPADAIDCEIIQAIRGTFVLGQERTLQQDVELGFRQIIDIAVRALSPGVNDPTTAESCLDRLAEILVRLGNRRMPRPSRTGSDGRITFVARETTFEQIAELCLQPLRHYGIGDAAFAGHLLRTVGRVGALVPPERRVTLAQLAREILDDATATLDRPEDQRRIRDVASEALAALDVRGNDAERDRPSFAAGGER